jgi:hypothetical protein
MVPSVPAQRAAHAIVTFSQRNVEVPAGESRDITVTITPPRRSPDAEKWIYSDYVIIDPINNSTGHCSSKISSQEAVHVPYMGMKGRLRDVHVFHTPGTYSFLRNLSNSSQISQPNETAIYTLENYELTIPWIGGIETVDGNHTVSDLPNGRYYLRVMVLRPFDDANNDNDNDIW